MSCFQSRCLILLRFEWLFKVARTLTFFVIPKDHIYYKNAARPFLKTFRHQRWVFFEVKNEWIKSNLIFLKSWSLVIIQFRFQYSSSKPQWGMGLEENITFKMRFLERTYSLVNKKETLMCRCSLLLSWIIWISSDIGKVMLDW